MNKEHRVALNFLEPVASDTDSHGDPKKYGFIKNLNLPGGGLFCNLILEKGMRYKIIYPEISFPNRPFQEAEGIFEYNDGETYLTDATVLLSDNSTLSGVECDISVLEKMQVINRTENDEITIVEFPPPGAGKSFSR